LSLIGFVAFDLGLLPSVLAVRLDRLESI
jgi:hypothetical protein